MQELQGSGFGREQASLIRSAGGGTADIFGRLGIPGHDANLYHEGLRAGGAVVVLQQLDDDAAHQAAAILDRHNVVDLDNAGQRFARGSESQTTSTSSSVQTGETGLSSSNRRTTAGSASSRNVYQGGEIVVPIVEEEVRVGKREVDAGGVRVHTRVEERPIREQVTLRDEEIQVERVPVNRPIDPATMRDPDEAFIPVSIEMREHDQQAVVTKEARVVEEVVIDKQVAQRTETVQDSVRRTDVNVQETGGQTSPDVGSTPSSDRV